MAQPTINNVAHSWSLIEISFGGNNGWSNDILQGVSSIKWNVKRNIKTNYGLGGEPVNRGFGNREYSASITLDYNAQAQLRALAIAMTGKGTATLMDLGEFDLIITWANDLGVGSTLTNESVTLKGCIFTEDGLEANQDDTNITKEFDLNPFKIESAVNAG